jgi:hypothetical protein
MVLGAGSGHSPLFDPPNLDMMSLSIRSGEFWGKLGSLCLPLLQWEMFLFLCGFCAFSAPVTLASAGGCAFALGRGFSAWHFSGNAHSALLLIPTTLFTALLAYRSFVFWNVLRDRHICHLYPTDHALLFRLCFHFFKIGGLLVLSKATMIVFLAFLQ